MKVDLLIAIISETHESKMQLIGRDIFASLGWVSTIPFLYHFYWSAPSTYMLAFVLI